MRRVALAVLVAAISVAAIPACGTSTSDPSPSVAPDNLLTPSDLSQYPAGSLKNVFLNYWSDLQFRSWANAVAYYDPAFRDFVGTATVIGAKKLNGTTYPLLKPTIVRTGASNGETTIYYTLRLPDGTKELNSMTWRKEGGNWQILYDSRLDAELAQVEQNRVEIEKNGSLPTDPNQGPSPAAAKAGSEASELQAHFRQQELKNEG